MVIESSNSVKVVLSEVSVKGNCTYFLDTPMVEDSGHGFLNIDQVTLTVVAQPILNDKGAVLIDFTNILIDHQSTASSPL